MDKPRGKLAQGFAPVHRLDTEPFGAVTGKEDREAALRDALRGMELGAHDQRMIEWACKMLDVTTLRVLVSWLERARVGAMREVLDVEYLLQQRQAVRS